MNEQMNRYKFGQSVGKGGLTEVFSAYDMMLNKPCAIKILRQDVFSFDMMSQLSNRFGYEVPRIAQIYSPNINPVYDCGNTNGFPFLVTGLMDGKPLTQYLGQPIAVDQAISFILPIAKSLSYAHQCGVLHLDVKPANIFVTNSGVPILTDLGVCRMMSGLAPVRSTSANPIGMGSPEYMAPEQVTGTGADGRTDEYSLTIVLFEILTGRRPFEDSSVSALSQQVNTQLPSPRMFGVNLPQTLEQILFTGAAKNPADRFQSMDAFVQALESFSQSNAIAANPYANSIPQNYAPNNMMQNNAYDGSSQLQQSYSDAINGYGYDFADVTQKNSKPNIIERLREFLSDPKKRLFSIITAVLLVLLIIISTVLSSINKKNQLNASNTALAATNQQVMTEVHQQMAQQAQSTVDEANRLRIAEEQTATAAAAVTPTIASTATLNPLPTIIQATSSDTTNGAVTAAGTNKANYIGQDPADGTTFAPEERFRITWNMENTGTTTWNTDYSLRHYSGDNFAANGYSFMNFPYEVPPQTTGGLWLDAVAPVKDGQYQMTWALSDPEQVNFAIVSIAITVKTPDSAPVAESNLKTLAPNQIPD